MKMSRCYNEPNEDPVLARLAIDSRRQKADLPQGPRADEPEFRAYNRRVKGKDRAIMTLRRKMTLLLGWSVVLCIGIPAGAEGFKVYISTDMEGCSGVTCSGQVAAQEGKQLMTGDMNACIEGCFAAGATEVVIRDHHGGGRNQNVMPWRGESSR